jgi:hypothetical protein
VLDACGQVRGATGKDHFVDFAVRLAHTASGCFISDEEVRKFFAPSLDDDLPTPRPAEPLSPRLRVRLA